MSKTTLAQALRTCTKITVITKGKPEKTISKSLSSVPELQKKLKDVCGIFISTKDLYRLRGSEEVADKTTFVVKNSSNQFSLVFSGDIEKDIVEGAKELAEDVGDAVQKQIGSIGDSAASMGIQIGDAAQKIRFKIEDSVFEGIASAKEKVQDLKEDVEDKFDHFNFEDVQKKAEDELNKFKKTSLFAKIIIWWKKVFG